MMRKNGSVFQIPSFIRGLSPAVAMMGLAWIMNHARPHWVVNFLYIDISQKREGQLRGWKSTAFRVEKLSFSTLKTVLFQKSRLTAIFADLNFPDIPFVGLRAGCRPIKLLQCLADSNNSKDSTTVYSMPKTWDNIWERATCLPHLCVFPDFLQHPIAPLFSARFLITVVACGRRCEIGSGLGGEADDATL